MLLLVNFYYYFILSSSCCCGRLTQVTVQRSPGGERTRYYKLDRLWVCVTLFLLFFPSSLLAFIADLAFFSSSETFAHNWTSVALFSVFIAVGCLYLTILSSFRPVEGNKFFLTAVVTSLTACFSAWSWGPQLPVPFRRGHVAWKFWLLWFSCKPGEEEFHQLEVSAVLLW